MAKKTSVPIIRLTELKKLAKQRKLSKKQLSEYFVVDRKSAMSARPKLDLDRDLVDVGRAAPTASEIGRIHAAAMGEAMASRPRPAKKGRARRAVGSRVRIVVEGDSWFRLPFWYPKDVVDYLDDDFDVYPLAMWRDTLKNIYAEKQYLQVLGGGLRRHLLLSGGGNDVLGSIRKYVDERRPGDTDPASAADYVRPQFARMVKTLIGYYLNIVAEIRAEIDVPVVVYVHGYANAIPKPGGEYLGEPLGKLGFDPVEHADMCAAIVRHMVGQFNQGLETLAGSHAGVVYVDLRPAFTSATDWHRDEIHPSSKGARKAARALADAVNASLPMV